MVSCILQRNSWRRNSLRFVFLAGLFVIHAETVSAFDCGKATSAVEKTICANTVLKAHDDRMAMAYKTLVSTLSEDERSELRNSQRGFIEERERCTESYEGPVTCILEKTEKRADLLSGHLNPSRIIGARPHFKPMIVYQKGDETQTAVNIEALTFSKPLSDGEKRYNRLIEQARLEAPLGMLPEDERGFGTHAYNLKIDLTLLTPTLIATEEQFYAYMGGAHGLYGTSGQLIDRATGHLITASDFLDPDAQSALFPLCKEQIIAEKKERTDDYNYVPEQDGSYSDATVKAALDAITQWVFTPEDVTVYFNPYELGSYAEGQYRCVFSMQTILSASKGRLTLS